MTHSGRHSIGAHKAAPPPNWRERGISFPLSKAIARGARLRWLPSGEGDVVLAPQPGSGSGIFVAPLRGLREAVGLSERDASIVNATLAMRPADPIAMARTIHSVERALDPAAPDAVEDRYRENLVRALERLETGLPGASAVFERRVAHEAADAVFAPSGLAAREATRRLEHMVRCASLVDAHRVDRLDAFADSLAAWSRHSRWVDAHRGVDVAARARRAADGARRHAETLSASIEDPLRAIVGPLHLDAERHATLLAWHVDGWLDPLELWREAAQGENEALENAAREIARLAPPIPHDTETLPPPLRSIDTGRDHLLAEVPRVTRATTIRAGVDWLTGLREHDALARRELLRPPAAESAT